MPEATSGSPVPSGDALFAELVVSQGITTPERVEECLSLLRRLADAGISRPPSLGELLVKKGYLSPSQFEGTLRLSETTHAPRPTAPRTAESSAIPSDAAEVSKDPASVFGKYVRVSRLGAGGMGEVWRAWDRDLGRWVALKFLRSESPEELARFRREAQTSARLNHPGICAVYEVGEAQGKPFIAMQYVEGATLQNFPQHDRKLLARMIRDAALAVHYAHEQGVVHRDLKPANLMAEGRIEPRPPTTRRSPGRARSPGPRVLVMDFGLAKQTSVDSSLSLSGAVLGTPAYMPPEQARGRLSEVGPRSDVYSLGATLYELLGGQPPFRAATVYDLLKKVVEEDPKPLRRCASKVEADLETIVVKSMEKDPARRYESALELAEDLTRYLEGEPIQAHPPSAAYRLRRWAGRRKAVVAVAAAGLLVSLLLAALIVPRWISEARETAEKERLLRDEQKARLAEYEMRERARPHLEAGRRIVEGMQVRMRDPSYTPGELVELARKAEPLFAKALGEYPRHAEAHYWCGRAWRLAGDEKKALDEIEKALAASPRLGSAYLERVRLRLGAYEKMMHKHSNAGEILPETPEAKALRERMESDLHRAEESAGDDAERFFASGILAYARGDHQSAEKTLDRYLATAPADSAAYYFRGLALLHLGRYEETRKEMTRAVECDRRNSFAYDSRGLALQHLGDLDAAMADHTRAIDVEPRNAGAYTNRGSARYQKRDFEGSIADFSRAIELDPRLTAAFVNRASVRRDVGNLDGAIEDCRKAIEIDPDVPSAYNNRGTVCYLKGDFKAAIADFTRTIEIDPKEARAYCNRGRARQDLGDVEGAVADYTKSIEVNPKYAGAFLNRGLVRRAAGKYEEAVADFKGAVEAGTLTPQTMTVVAWELLTLPREDLRDPGTALRCASKAAELTGRRDALILGTLALALFRTGKVDDAVTTQRLSIDLLTPGQSRFRQEFQNRLKEYEAAAGPKKP